MLKGNIHPKIYFFKLNYHEYKHSSKIHNFKIFSKLKFLTRKPSSQMYHIVIFYKLINPRENLSFKMFLIDTIYVHKNLSDGKIYPKCVSMRCYKS